MISAHIIDDNEADRYILKRAIKDSGVAAKIFESCHGQEALDFLLDYENNVERFNGDYPPIINFLDINMPLLDGFAFLEKFSEARQSMEVYKSVVFMMYSSSESEIDRKKVEGYEFVCGYLTKGAFTPEDIREKAKIVWG